MAALRGTALLGWRWWIILGCDGSSGLLCPAACAKRSRLGRAGGERSEPLLTKPLVGGPFGNSQRLIRRENA